MKLVSRVLTLLILSSVTLFFANCDNNNGGTESVQSVQFKKLTGTWAVVSANDGTNRTDFDGVTLTLSGTFAEDATYSYTIAGTLPNPSPWPKGTGTWRFGNDPATELIRDPETNREIPCEYSVSDDGTTLSISFTIPDGSEGFPGGRIQSVTGAWVFNFQKQ